ncbi:MAG TPA: protein kinase [Acidimicrobiales bacterium]|nr:protein kinase [Acidimicrobiales bacterium]
MASSRITDSVGRVLGQRYRLTRPIGSGASAHVYVAEDVELRRRVAVKVLHPGLAGDEAFLRRFRAEARVVAPLRHPHILRIYDWGEDEGDPYLVSELLEGGSLRSLLDQGTLLTPTQAATVGYEAASALDHAHRRGLVHRDVKPANLLFDDEGRVSVADFGIARALAEATWTEPAGAMVGTARYAAPEQVQGQPLGDRSDVYALALVLTEATTGSVPFATDTTLGTLMARVGRPLEVGEEAGPLGEVLRAAGAPDPDDRPSAADLAKQLRRLVTRLPPPAPLPLAAPLQGGFLEVDPDPTSIPGLGTPRPGREPGSVLVDRFAPPEERVPTAGRYVAAPPPPDASPDEVDAPVTGPSPTVTRSGLAGPDPTAQTAPGPVLLVPPPPPPAGGPPVGGAPTPPAPTPPAPIPSAPPADGPVDDEPVDGEAPAGRRRGRVVALVLVAVLVLAGAGAGAWALTRKPPLEAIPALHGDTVQTARAALHARHLQLAVAGRAYDATVPKGAVISQVPAGGHFRRGATVAVTISRGPQPVAIPSVQGVTLAQAEKLLRGNGLTVGAVRKQTSLTVPAGSVITSSPAGGTALPGKAVALVESTGKPSVTVPLLKWPQDSSWQQASAALSAAHLHPVESLVYNNKVSAGLVVYTSPAPNAVVRWGAPVTVLVSRGPHLVTLPTDLAGQSVAAATSELQAIGVGVSGVRGNPTAPVTGSVPALGSAVLYGGSVQLVTH